MTHPSDKDAAAAPRADASADARTVDEAEGPSSLRGRVVTILDLIRPAIQSDGGDVELVDVREDGTVVLRFLGACIGCPSSNMTLQVGIERQLCDRIPEVTGVETVE